MFANTFSPQNMWNSPPMIEINKIKEIRDNSLLEKLEKQYDDFLKKNEHLLLLHDIIEEYLDIRDAIIVQSNRIKRNEQNKKLMKILNKNTNNNNNKPQIYTHDYQAILHPDLRLSDEEIVKGYIPCPFEPREFKCGCETIRYFCPCICTNDLTNNKCTNSKCTNSKCSENIHPEIGLQLYCGYHSNVIKKQKALEKELTKVQKELKHMYRRSNNWDYQEHIKLLSKTQDLPRRSPYPWKNI